MKKTAIVSLALLLAACSSSDYESDVQSESYQENYQTNQTEVDENKAEIVEEDVAIVEEEASEIKEQDAADTEEVAKESEAPAKTSALAPTEGFSIQLATISDEEKAKAFAKALNTESALWLQAKEINDKPVYSVLMGDFGDYDEAKAAVAALPEGLQKLKPFVKNFTDKELAATDSFQLLK
ncbi:SPOR domain-containing protein [Vibrio superstes]|uniref:Cytochrome c biogenesis protein CcdA n=1 Tax=Vibrio superstes NBRC 103154 TaxID=1219062 RepID=A0A511QPW0_9VIBR|nr:SPOR domain-containing protein [Vibrio superstes]GEM79373.1 cytochrome c biogenesis protein CcdA [Vibrio superstes NBRC 103154]